MSDITDEEAKIVRCALAWYRSNKPLDWSHDQQDALPDVNCVGPIERDLARAVAEWLIRS